MKIKLLPLIYYITHVSLAMARVAGELKVNVVNIYRTYVCEKRRGRIKRGRGLC